MRCIRLTRYPNSYGPVACGQCIPCRITKRTRWRTRLLLENKYWSSRSLFVTLTYAPEYLPDSQHYPGGNLCRSDVQKFIKRLRRAFSRSGDDRKITYYAVGEYGEKSLRAHYHVLLFNVDLHDELLVRSCWKFGHLHFGESNKDTIAYTLGYTLKKMTSEKDFPDGRTPEFALMSQGIGIRYLEPIAARLIKRGLYPSRSHTAYQEFVQERYELRYFERGFKQWDGTFYADGVRCSFDSFVMSKLATLVDGMLGEFFTMNLTYDDLDIYFKNKPRWLVRINRLTSLAESANIAFVKGYEYEEVVKQAKKIHFQAISRHKTI